MQNINFDDIIKRYYSGEPINKLAKEFGIGRLTLTNRFKQAGVILRSRSEAISLMLRNRTPEEKIKYSEAAHKAVKGKKYTLEELEYRSKCYQSNPKLISPYESAIAQELVNLGVTVAQQFSISKYNVDILAGGLIAVEIYGGGWHSSRDHSVRDKYILDQGFDRFTIWVGCQHHLFDPVRCADQIVAFLNFRCGFFCVKFLKRFCGPRFFLD